MTLTGHERALIDEARRAVLATVAPDGHPRLVPICFVLLGDVLWSPLDEKPKAVEDVRSLARVRDILARPDVGILVDRWSEDWIALVWVRVRGRATLVEAGDTPASVVAALRTKYPQYADHDLAHRPMIAVTIEQTSSWVAASDTGP